MRKSELGFAARETELGAYKFQAVVLVASRNGEAMTKTLNPHGKLLSEQETKQLGYDTERIIDKARSQRKLPSSQSSWRRSLLERVQRGEGSIISWQDLW